MVMVNTEIHFILPFPFYCFLFRLNIHSFEDFFQEMLSRVSANPDWKRLEQQLPSDGSYALGAFGVALGFHPEW